LFSLPFKNAIQNLLIFSSRQLAISSRNNLAKEIEKLKKESLILTFKIKGLESLEEENRKLRVALNFKEQNKISLIGVEIIAYSPLIGEKIVFVDLKNNNNIRPGMFVIDENGNLFGKILEVKDDFASIIIVSDPDFNLQVFIGEGNIGLLKGTLKGAKIMYVEDAENLKTKDPIWFQIPYYNIPIKIGEIKKIQKSQHSLFWEIEASLSFRDCPLNKLFIIE
jgi:cell shape-determining protein MreC